MLQMKSEAPALGNVIINSEVTNAPSITLPSLAMPFDDPET
jgi:hypothetical protein